MLNAIDQVDAFMLYGSCLVFCFCNQTAVLGGVNLKVFQHLIPGPVILLPQASLDAFLRFVMR